MSVIKKPGVRRRTVSLHQKVKKLNLNNNTASITFVRHDKSKIVQNINKEFLFHENGKKKTNNELISDIHALSHDLGAKYFML